MLIPDRYRRDCLKRLLKPLARFFLSQAETFQNFSALAKEAFIEASIDELRKRGEKVNVSRISAATGLNRTEVTRLYREEQPAKQSSESVVGQVLVQWEQDKEFHTSSGKPRALTYKGAKSEFYQLVEKVNKHFNPGTILFELQRIGIVKAGPNRLTLLGKLVTTAVDVEESFELASQDIGDYLKSIPENVLTQPKLPHLHIRTEYDRIDVAALPKIRRWLIDSGKEFHKQARSYLAQFDLDINPSEDPAAKGARVALTAFSAVEE